MIKVSRNHIATVLIASAITVAGPAVAGNSSAGQEKSMVCQGCHGQDGNSYGPEWPNLAGQHASYLEKQLANFQDGKRTDATMSGLVTDLSKEDMQDIAVFFAQQKLLPPPDQEPAGDLALGKKIYKGGNTYNEVPACASCHGPNGIGNSPAVFPRIAGQKVEYLIKTMSDFKLETRANDPNEIMRNIASRLSEKEIKAVSAYVANLQPATITAKTQP